jgi:hypothetical protein
LAVKNRPARPLNERSNPFLKEELKKHNTDPCFLIGNGKSRQHFDLERLRPYGTIFGCNALYRDFTPDVLMAIDAKMLKEIRESEYSGEENTIVVPQSRTVAIPGSYKWKSERFNTTGCFGMHLIARCVKPKICYMLGMDGYAGNMYDSTVNYQKNTLKNFSGVNQFYMRALKSDKMEVTKFVNVNDKDGWLEEVKDMGNYMYITYDEFEEIIAHEAPMAE